MASVQSNLILYFKEVPFSRSSNEDKLATKQLGPPRQNLNIKQVSNQRGKSYNQGFSQKTHLAGCEAANALFCYPCTPFHPDGSMTDTTTWTTTGVNDMHHLSEKVKKHKSSKTHMDSCLRFSAFGRVNIATQLDESYRLVVRHHNDEVSKNRHILARLIDKGEAKTKVGLQQPRRFSWLG